MLREVTAITPLQAMLFGGELHAPSGYGRVEIDQWLPLYVRADDPRAARVIITYRQTLDRMLETAFKRLASVDKYLDDPEMNVFVRQVIDLLKVDDGQFLSVDGTNPKAESWSSMVTTWKKETERLNRKVDGVVWQDGRPDRRRDNLPRAKESNTSTAELKWREQPEVMKLKNLKNLWGDQVNRNL